MYLKANINPPHPFEPFQFQIYETNLILQFKFIKVPICHVSFQNEIWLLTSSPIGGGILFLKITGK